MIATPGLIRIRGTGRPLLAGEDIQIECQQGDGSWLPLRGVCSARIAISADELVLATVEIEIGVVELDGVTPNVIVWRDRRSRWQRLISWVRRR